MDVESNVRDATRARRRFLARCEKFAAVTPPTVTLMLTAAHGLYAASRSGSHGNNGFRNGGHDGVPGKSGKHDIAR